MKKFLLLFMTIFLFGLLSSVRSQETVTIGTGSEDMYTLHNWGWDRVALLYTSDEIDYNGYISKLAFHILGQSTSSSNANRSIKIYLKTIQEDALFASGILSGSWNSVKADAELVYEESDYTCVTGQWKEFDLTNGYDYDGTGNLLVLIEGIGCSPSGSCNIRFSGTSAVSDKYWYGRKDTSAPNDDSNAASVDYGSIPSSAQTTRPNIQITIEETFNCKKPRNIAISNILTNSATLNWQAPSTEPDNGYQIYLSTSSVTPAEDVTPSYSVSTSTLSQDISGLNTGSLYYVWIRSVCENDEYSAWSNPVYFYTKQNAASIPYAQDFETSSENSNWILLNGNQTNKWYIASIAGASSDYGTKGLYISNNNGYANGYDISATSYVYAYRTLNFDEATNYRIKFDWRSYGQSNSDIVRAFLVPESVNLQYGQANGMTGTTNTVPNGWIALSSSLSGQNSWQTFENEFTIDGEENLTGSYNLVFFWKNDNTTGTQPPASIDNISVVKIEECFVPINLSADNINHNSAGISWQLLGAASSTNIIVSTVAITDFEEATLTEQYYSGTTYNTATDLTPQTTYYVYVQAVCAADDLSEWSEALTFTTPQAFAFLPYSHDFAAGSEENANWILANGTQNNKWYIGSTTSGTYTVADGLYISSNSGASNTYSTSYASYTYAYRRMSIDQAGYLSIEFDWRANGESNYDLLRAFLVPESLVSSLTAGSANGMNSDSNTPPTGWIDLTNGKLNLQTGIQHLSSEIEIGTTGIYYLVFFWKNDSSGGTIPPAYVDNIVMSVVTCLKPINLAVSGITTNSANISWTAREDASIWNIIVSDEAITDFTDVTPTAQNLSSAEYSAESLNSATTYYVYVQSVCDVDNLSEWANVTFNTLAAPAELPYECGFDNVTENNSWNFIDHSGKTDKWHIGSTTSGSYAVTNGLYVSGDNGASNTYSSTYTYIYAYRKLNLEDIGTYRIKFDWRCYGESANYDYLRAFLVPDNITITAGSENSIGSSSTPTNWISLSNGPIYQNSNWSTLSTDVEISSSGLYKLVFYWRTDSGTSNPPAAAIDNISVKHISCSSPSNPVATNITNSSANISWTGGEETAWNIKISTEEITDFTGIIPDAQNLSSATYSAESLNSATTYYVYVQAICDIDDLSEWSDAGTFTTLCEAYSLPLTEGFNNSTIPDCWSQDNVTSGSSNITYITNSSTYPTNVNPYEGTHMAAFGYSGSTRLVTPILAIEDIESIDLSFWWYHGTSYPTYNNEGVQIQYSFDGETWTNTGDFIKRYNTTAGWVNKIHTISGIIDNEDYIYIGLLFTSLNGDKCLLDELKIYKTPTCPAPIDIIASNITSSSADISWTGGEETAWNIKISTEEITDFTGIIPDAQNLSSATYSAGSLNSQTPYYVYVQAICDVDDLSEWSYAGIFTTLCGTFSLPLAEGFNTSGSSVFPDCWTQQNVSGTANITFETTQYHEGTRSVRFPYTSSSQTRLVSPSISIENISSVDLEFWWYHNSSGGSTSYQNEGVQVQYSFDGETWTDIGDFIKRYAETSGWEKKEIIIPSLNENDVLYIGFLAYGRGSYYYAYMDELKISESPSCYPPLVISASAITSNSADISWTPRGEEAEWNIIISETAITDFTNEDIDIPNHGSTTYSLSVLDVQTPYYVYVQAICDVNDLSTWSEYSFSTLAAPANLPYECAFDNDSENSAWNLLSHSGKTDKWYIGNTTSGTYTVTNGLYVSGNNGASNTYSSADTYIYAFRELNLEDIGTYRIKFDWRCYGENEGFAYDYVRAFLVPQDITVEGGNIYGMTENSNVSTPSGWIDVSGVLKWKNTIQELEREIPVYQNGIYKLAFLWKTDGGVNNNPPASIYNISVEFIECAAPINFAASDITNSSATISWNEGELSAWNIILSETAISNFDDEVPTVSNHTSTSYSLSELAENTTYYVYIQGICEDDEVTGWSGTSFTTERLCGIVENITIPTITVTENSATISWTEGFANIGTYDIIISTSEITDFSDITPTESNISGTSYNATGLPHNTRHYVYIRANCSNDVLSTWVGSSFMTKCGDLITSYPYFEGFNDAALSECWTELNEDNGSQRWTPSTTQKYEGDRSIFVRYESSSLTNNDWLISPKFQVQEGLNMEFWARAYSSTWSEDFNILVSKTGTATADFNITLQSVTNHGATWTKFDYQLDAITGINIGDEIYFAIQYVSTNKYGLYVDAFRVYVPSSENDILTFSVANQIGESVIDTENHTVYAEIHYGESLTTLAPAITISDYATISPASGTARDFTTPVIYTVTSESGVAQEWTVTVVNASTPSSENDILSFDFPGRMGNVDIDTDNHTVTAQLRFDFDITVITPVFTVSNYATATPASGTVQDFSAPFVYAVEAQDESVQNWTVNITHAPVPVGGNCSNPVVVDFASDIPYNVTEQTTCGYGNLGEVIGCANGGGNGEDVVYRLDVDVPVYATFTLDPKGTANSTMTVHNSCDSYSGFLFCSWSNGGSIEYSHVIYPGSYYMIININTNNGCIPDYDFSITVETDACLSISNMEINDLTQNTATVSWTNGFIETSWDIKYGQQGFDPGTGGTLISGVTTNPYTITGLNENVRYDVYVKPACETNWSTNTTFRTLANCPMPVDVTVSNITQDEAEINWNGYNATAWDIIISESMLLDPDTYPNPLNVTTTAHQAQSLDAGTIYYVYVRANCGSDEYSYWTYVTEFITLQEPSAIPFTSDFESPQENANWTILNGDQNNRWYIGNAVNNGGASSLYISNNEGVSNSYLTNMTSYVYAYRTLDIQTTDLLVIDFDYKVNGENNNDVLNVYLIPQDVELSAGNAYGMTGSVNTPPASWIKVNESPLSSQTTWADFYETITVPTTGTYNLVFFWKNNATSGSQSPAAIDNIVVRVASNENDILSFEMDEQTQPAVIDATAHTVSLEVEYNVSLTSLVPAITISDYASISPASGTAQDFTNPVTYTVTAENGDDQDWIVTVVNAPSPENDILSFSMTEELCEATIDADAKTIIIGVAGGTDVTSLIPTITISDLASISPASGVAQDFTNPVSYTVTAENGDEAEWTITVSVISLTCPEDITVATGTTQEFSGYSPLGGTFSGEGVSGNSFDATSLAREDYDVTYTYIDEETGCEQSCDFTVTVASGENNIITFYVAEQLCGSRIDADAKTIVIGVPHDTDVTSLTPVATISEYATMSPASGIVQDFTNPVTYNVTAESGDIQAWTVTVIELPEITCPDDMDLTIGTIANFEGYSPADGIFSGQGLETAISGNTINTTGLSSNIYAVTYTYTEPQTGCEISCNFNINIHVGIVSNEVAAISVYPNPNSGNFFIELDGINGLATYQIVDTKGSLLHQETISVNNDSIEEVSVNLVPGIYYVKIITDTQTIIEKITVQ